MSRRGVEEKALPEGWQQVEMKSIISIRKEKYDPDISHEGTVCIDLEHIEKVTGKILSSSISLNKQSTKSVFFAGDVLYGKLRPNLRKYAFPQFNGICSSEIWVFKVNTDICMNKFVFYLVQSDNFTKIACRTTGTKMPRADWKVLQNFTVRIPPLPEQKAIASLLETWDMAIEKTEALIAVKEKRFKWLLKTLISDQRDNPSWREVKLGEMYNISAAGDFNAKKSSPIQDEEHPYPIYSNALTNKGLHSYSTYAKYSEDSITITGRGDIGFANHRKEKFMAIGRLLILKNKSSVSNEFVCEYINHSIRFHKETTGVPQLTAPQVSKYCIVLPSLAEQKKIGYMLNVAKNEIFLLQRLVEQYRKQKRGLMQKLLIGKWKVK